MRYKCCNISANFEYAESSISSSVIWIGYNDLAIEGTWVWADGSIHQAGDYEGWTGGEVSNWNKLLWNGCTYCIRV